MSARYFVLRVPVSLERRAGRSLRQFLEFYYPHGCWGQAVVVHDGFGLDLLAVLLAGDE